MKWSDFTALDYLFAAIVLASIGFAIFKGFVREIISLAALIIGLFLAAWFYPVAAAPFMDFSKNETVASFIGFLIIFLGCLLLGALAAYLIKRIVKMASLEWMDRLLGGLFGLLRGWAVCSIIVLALIAFPVRENLVARSFFAPLLLAGARAAVLVVPRELKDKFYEQYKKVLDSWNQNRSSA